MTRRGDVPAGGAPSRPRRRGGIGLRGRLVAFFVVITVVPLTAAVLALQIQIDRQLQVRGEQELASVRGAAVALISGERDRAADFAGDLADRFGTALSDGVLTPDLDGIAAQLWLEDTASAGIPDRADLAALADADGAVVATVGRDPEIGLDLDVPTVVEQALAGEQAPEGALLEIRELRVRRDGAEELVGWIITGLWTDAQLLDRLGLVSGAALVSEGTVVAAAGASRGDIPVAGLPAGGDVGVIEIGDETVSLTAAPLTQAGGTSLALWTARSPRAGTFAIGLLILVPSMLLAVVLGWFLANAVIAPVRRAADIARTIAAGDLSRSLEPTGGPELADLATALNAMRVELARQLEELARSRDQLRGTLDRLGLTLSSSLDLNRTLAVVVETTLDTLGADRALLLLLTPERDALFCKVARGVTPPPAIDLGDGVVGHVARDAVPVLLPGDDERGVPAHAKSEPSSASQIAVPLLGRGRVLGVMTLLRDDPDNPFTRTDLDTIRSFAAQASVAIENVLLHREARRLSVTDSLTGLWNFRYFQLQAERELESATRFDRQLALVIIDIDHFKVVNDEYGHQVGDTVLAEIAARIRSATRVPDVVARYGGEEFVVLLPGTGFRGAIATAERIRRAIADEPIDVRGTPVAVSGQETRPAPGDLAVTCSAGVAAFPDHGRTVAALLRSADAAMYVAKQQGRDRVVGAEDLASVEPVELGPGHREGGLSRREG